LRKALLIFFSRFIINLPEEERSSFERLGFQVEQAFWFYDDFYRPTYPHLPRLTLRSFGQVLLQRYPPLIAPFGRNFDKLYEEFMAYKHAIPVCGAIILNETLTKVNETSINYLIF
jgi:mRNA-decapping enzyme subunit 2